MVTPGEIAAGLTALKGIKDIAQAMIGLRDEAAFQAKAIELQSKVADAQQGVFAANEERASLLEQVRELQQRVARLEAWESEKQRYKLERLDPGVFVYTLKSDMAAGEPEHHICQTCFQRGKKSLLHGTTPTNGTHHLKCYECNTDLRVGHPRPLPSRADTGGSWMSR